jgi:hypothetical protein
VIDDSILGAFEFLVGRRFDTQLEAPVIVMQCADAAGFKLDPSVSFHSTVSLWLQCLQSWIMYLRADGEEICAMDAGMENVLRVRSERDQRCAEAYNVACSKR